MKKTIILIVVGIFLSILFISEAGSDIPQKSRFFYSGDGKIALRSARSGAAFSGVYRNADGTYRPDAIRRINAVFGAAASPQETISLRLVEFLDYLQDKFNGKTLTIVSGYRSPEYNTNLRENGALAGKASLHQYGMATDFSMARVSSKAIWEYVRDLKFGGVGFYHGKNVHIDVGPARWWDETSSKVGTDIADENKLIMLVTDRDIYRPGETTKLMFARMTAWPIGVQTEFVLEQTGEKWAKKILPSIEGSALNACHVFNDWRPMLNMPWQLPVDLAPGRYTVRAKFCDKQWDAMPPEITTSEFEVTND